MTGWVAITRENERDSYVLIPGNKKLFQVDVYFLATFLLSAPFGVTATKEDARSFHQLAVLSNRHFSNSLLNCLAILSSLCFIGLLFSLTSFSI
jgi:hypothetical protein